MLFRFSALLILSIAVAASAQQGTSDNSSSQGTPGTRGSQSTAPPSNSGTSSKSEASPRNSANSQNAQKSASQPLKPATPDELKFPEDDPSQPAPAPPVPSAPSSSTSPDTPRTLTPPRSDRVEVQDLGRASGESSSKDSGVDLSPPSDDAKQHPQSSEAVSNAEADSLKPGGVTELRTWDPHKAAKDVEVGDFYFKRGNYRAAEARYRDALLYKDNDAIATIKLAECLEKLGVLDDARSEYESYLKILPHGPQAEQARKGIARLNAQAASK